MRVLVCGDRNWMREDVMEATFRRLLSCDAVVIHGDCRGADRMAAAIARRLGYSVEAFPANWQQHGLAAGPIRNRQMLDTLPELVLAFHDDLEKSRGTKHCVEEARRRGIVVLVVTSKLAAASLTWVARALGRAGR